MWGYILIVVISYLCGSFNSAIEFSKRVKGKDIRESGSGNAGMTNMLRTYGKMSALAVIIGDIAKTTLGMYTSMLVASLMHIDKAAALQISALVIAMGHCFPIYYGFKGGKGVLTTIVAAFIINPQIMSICLLFGLAVLAISRMMSLASVFGVILLPILFYFLDPAYTLYGIIIAAVIVWSHRSNIQRIFNGTENKFTMKKSV